MFETAYPSAGTASRRPWTFTVSLVGEVFLVAALALVPLLTTPEIAGAFEGAIFLAAPPSPPAPTSPAPTPAPAAPAAPERFVAELTMPAVMPDRAARIIEGRVERPVLASESAATPGLVEAVPGTSYVHRLFPAQAPAVAPPPRPRPRPQTRPADPPSRIAVTTMKIASLVHQVKPEYPDAARRARISGIVKLKAVISTDGRIQELAAVSGHPWHRRGDTSRAAMALCPDPAQRPARGGRNGNRGALPASVPFLKFA